MTLVATCTNCEDQHSVGDRPARGETTCCGTSCPQCDHPGYYSKVIDEDVESEADKIEDALEGVDGIGTKNKQNVIDAFVRYTDFERASASKLTDIRGVGSQTAKNIIDAR